VKLVEGGKKECVDQLLQQLFSDVEEGIGLTSLQLLCLLFVNLAINVAVK